ncbi:MAG: NifB/NifX family molybdenum-iron cluster-binding protein [Planctomycetota bacterium]|jgi:predicted Fe-Mo cluster-binding NifX family protein
MKIAVASNDGVSISHHFGRSKCFIIFETDDGKIAGKEIRDNTYTPFAKGECKDPGEHHHQDQPHSHADIIKALYDCDVIMCCGMGWRAAEDLKRCGTQPVVIDTETSPEDAVKDFLAGKMKSSKSFCSCHE